MVVYVAIGGLAVGALIAMIGFMRPGSRIDWSIVPGDAVVPLWIADSLAAFAGFVVAAIPAPIGFFRRSRGLEARSTLLIYVAATLLIAVATVGSPVYLMTIGAVRISANTSVLFGAEDVLSAALISAVAAAPVVAALAALRRPTNHPLQGTGAAQRGFEVQEVPGRGPGP